MSSKITWRERLNIFLISIFELLFSRLHGDGWTHIPVWHEDMPVVIVPMNAPEYQALVLLGYSTPEDQETDWDTVPPYGMGEAAIATMRQKAIAAMRETVRRHVAAAEE